MDDLYRISVYNTCTFLLSFLFFSFLFSAFASPKPLPCKFQSHVLHNQTTIQCYKPLPKIPNMAKFLPEGSKQVTVRAVTLIHHRSLLVKPTHTNQQPGGQSNNSVQTWSTWNTKERRKAITVVYTDCVTSLSQRGQTASYSEKPASQRVL